MSDSAKDLVVKPVATSQANAFVRRHHYSGKVVPNSQLSLGVFWNGKLEGVMQFGPSINKKGTIGVVANTAWNGFIELNRMAFSEKLPRNSESRAIAVAFRILRKHYPHIEWVVSFADATQCGDGAIYRASGFVLTDIRKSDALRRAPDGSVMHIIQAHHLKLSKEFRSWKPLEGYQLRYVYFINPKAKERLTVPIIPNSKIAEMGISMYRGKHASEAGHEQVPPVQRRCNADPDAPSSNDFYGEPMKVSVKAKVKAARGKRKSNEQARQGSGKGSAKRRKAATALPR